MKRANRELRALETDDFDQSSTLVGGATGLHQDFSPRGTPNMSAFNTHNRGRRRNTGVKGNQFNSRKDDFDSDSADDNSNTPYNL